MRFQAIFAAAAFVAIAGSAQAEDGSCSEWREAGVIGDLRCETVDGGAVIGAAARAGGARRAERGGAGCRVGRRGAARRGRRA